MGNHGKIQRYTHTNMNTHEHTHTDMGKGHTLNRGTSEFREPMS